MEQPSRSEAASAGGAGQDASGARALPRGRVGPGGEGRAPGRAPARGPDRVLERAPERAPEQAPEGQARSSPAVPAGSAILRAVGVLEAIAANETPPQLAEISRAVGLPKPTVLRILGVLEHAGLVTREPGSKRYHSGARMRVLAGATLIHSPARAARHAILEELVEEIGETCNLTIPNGNAVMYLDRVEAAWPLRIALGAGSSVPLHASASGKLFLAAMSRRARERFVATVPLVRHTRNTVIESARLVRELERVRQQGYAVDDEEYLSGICCLAVPVLDSEGRTVAGLAMHAPVARMSLAAALEFLPVMKRAAEAIARTLEW